MKGFLNIFSNKNTINAQNKSTENKISNQANIKLVNKYSSNQNTNNTKINKGGFITNTSTTANENPGISEYSNKIKQKDGIDAIFAASKSMILEDAKIEFNTQRPQITQRFKTIENLEYGCCNPDGLELLILRAPKNW